MPSAAYDCVVAERVRAFMVQAPQDGVDGPRVLMYGEGWEFGEIAGDQRGRTASCCSRARMQAMDATLGRTCSFFFKCLVFFQEWSTAQIIRAWSVSDSGSREASDESPSQARFGSSTPISTDNC